MSFFTEDRRDDPEEALLPESEIGTQEVPIKESLIQYYYSKFKNFRDKINLEEYFKTNTSVKLLFVLIFSLGIIGGCISYITSFKTPFSE